MKYEYCSGFEAVRLIMIDTDGYYFEYAGYSLPEWFEKSIGTSVILNELQVVNRVFGNEYNVYIGDYIACNSEDRGYINIFHISDEDMVSDSESYKLKNKDQIQQFFIPLVRKD